MIRTTRSVLLVLGLTATLLASTFPSEGNVQLEGPKVLKLSWNSRGLTVVDLDGDGRNDLALLDNDRARIDLLYQRRPGEKVEPRAAREPGRWDPTFDDAPFRVESLSLAGRAFDLAAADLNADGRPDLVFTGSPDGLTVRYQDDDGSFERTRTYDLESPSKWRRTVVTADLNGDSRTDLAILATDVLAVYVQTDDGILEARGHYPLTGEERYALRILDLNGDRIPDVMYQVTGSGRSVRIRFGDGSGDFGPELAASLSERRGSMTDLRTDDSGVEFVSINQANGAVETVRFVNRPSGEVPFEEIQPWIIAVRPAGEGGDTAAAVGDFDGNGRNDLALADARRASIELLVQTDRGRFRRTEAYPSLAEIKTIVAADVDGDDRDDLVVVSPGERVLAWTTIDDRGRLAYPTPIPIGEGKPLAVAAGDLTGDGHPSIMTIVERDKHHAVVVLQSGDRGASWTAATYDLDDLRVPPRGLTLADANQDGRPDIVVFTAHEPSRILLQSPEGDFEPASEASGFQRGLLDDLDPSALTTGDIDSDGRAELLVAGKGFVRALRIGPEGVLEVVDQFNGRDAGTAIEAGVVWQPGRQGPPEVALVDRRAGSLERLTRSKDGVYRWRSSVELDSLDFQRAIVTDLGHGPGKDLLLVGTDRMTWVSTAGDDLRAETTVIHETDPLEIRDSLVLSGDLDSDGVADIVTIDATDSRVLEVLQRKKEHWRSTLQFTLFEADPHYEGQTGGTYEPREGFVADVTDDGRDDLILLVHDRLLVYPQSE